MPVLLLATFAELRPFIMPTNQLGCAPSVTPNATFRSLVHRKAVIWMTTFVLLMSSAGLSQPCADLFISEYIEGSGFNKSLELYNPTALPIDLSNYSISYYINGSTSPSSTFNPSGTLNPGDVYVITNQGATDMQLINQADTFLSGTATVVNYNGDDAVALYHGTTAIDILGTVGVDPGLSWTVLGTNGFSGSTRNQTLRRDTNVQAGQTNWTIGANTEWVVFANNTTSDIGQHLMIPCAPGLQTGSLANAGWCLDGGSTSFVVPFVATGPMNGSNIYYLELSGPNGSFASPDTVGSMAGNMANGNITAIVPAGIPNGTAYRVRVVSSAPTITGSTNGVDFFLMAGPTLNLATNPITCNGLNDGNLSGSVVGGNLPFSYSWNSGDTNATQNNLGAGTYTLVVSDSFGCVDTALATLTDPAAMVTSGMVSNVSCFGASDGGVAMANTGGTTPYSYAWTGGSTAANLTAVGGGVYSVTVTDANGCSNSPSFTIAEPTEIQVSSQVVDPNCDLSEDGSIDLTSVTGGAGLYLYAWSTGAITQDENQLAAGSYSVVITDVDGCSKLIPFTLVGINPSPVLSVAPVGPTCSNCSDGSIVVSPTAGTTPYTYQWSNGSTTANLNGLPSGTYTVTVTDAAGCGNISTVVLQNGPVGIEDPGIGNAFRLYPNPAGSHVTLEHKSETSTSLNVQVIDALGRPVLQNQWNSGSKKLRLDLSSLTQGWYEVLVVDQQFIHARIKLIHQ